MTGTWCDTAKVAELTDVTVTDAQLLKAQGVIETFVDVDPADPGEHLSVRDRERLVKATAYQAGWMFEKIELFSRTDVENLSQDGTAFRYANPDAVVLAPLADRNIAKLSWNASGPVGPKCGAKYGTIFEVEAATLRDEVDPVPWTYESEGV